MGAITAWAHNRAVRLEHSEEASGESGYVALYVTQDAGQWSLACDATYGTEDERQTVHLQMLDLITSYLKIGVPFP